jgi:hypothetical protein
MGSDEYYRLIRKNIRQDSGSAWPALYRLWTLTPLDFDTRIDGHRQDHRICSADCKASGVLSGWIGRATVGKIRKQIAGDIFVKTRRRVIGRTPSPDGSPRPHRTPSRWKKLLSIDLTWCFCDTCAFAARGRCRSARWRRMTGHAR